MKGKSYAVIGLGQFGSTLAEALAESDCDVLVVDVKEEAVQEVAEKVAYAVKADVREPGTLKKLGVQNVDVVIVGIAENIEASITATMQAKELGVPFVMAKAINGLHGRILEKIGADKVIYPEQDMGLRVARNLVSSGFADIFELSSKVSMAEFEIPSAWVGKTLTELKIREKYKLNIIGIKRGDEVNVELSPMEPLPDNCTMIAIGNNRDLNRVPEN